MYTSKNFQIRDEETFSLCIPTDRDYKILQLTDLQDVYKRQMQEQFWCNVLLGIFGGAVLTSITSIMGYFVGRRHALEDFYLETIKLLKRYNKYQTDLTPDQKINFFLELSNYDMNIGVQRMQE